MKKLTLAAAIFAALILGWLAQRPRDIGSAAATAPDKSLPQAQELPVMSNSREPASPAVLPVDPSAVPAASAQAASPGASLAPGMRPPQRRAWDPAWLQGFAGQVGPVPVRFELLGGEVAEGVVLRVEENADHVVLVSGTLSQPESGSFFFRRQSLPSVAGTHVGVVQLPGTGRAFRLEPSEIDGGPVLVSRRMDEVVCLRYAMPPGTASSAATAPADPEQAPFVDVSQHPTFPTPDYQNGIPVLESLPGARGVIYLDFDGETTSQWGDGTLIVARRSNFIANDIREIWRLVAADYTSFTINLTTDLRVFERAPENSRIRVIITPTPDAQPGAGGVAFIGSWNWTGDTPCWVFNASVKDAAEAISHEVGHTLGLSHDGRPGEEYYTGHGSGETGWAPIMGVGYGKPVVQWSKGEYANASNKEDDLRTIITANTSVGYRADDHGGTFATATYLEIYDGGVVTNRGIIERNTDVDVFRFSTTGGLINLTARPASIGADLAIRLELTDSADQVLVSVSPANALRATLSTNLPLGDYAVTVRGAGRGANATVGFTAYGSLGYYQLGGTVQGGVEPIRLRIAENSPDGTRVGDLNAFAAGPGPRTFVATGGNGVSSFTVGSNGEVTVAQSGDLNFETREQFQLLVDIQYPDNPLLNETGRRVVVAVTDVNEAPVITAGPLRIFDRTRSGTTVGAVTASDPDLYTRLRYAISEGNEAGWFSINGSGELKLRRDLDSGVTSFRLRVDAWDAGTPPITNSVEAIVEVMAPPGGLQPGGLEYAHYSGILGTAIRDLTNHASFPRFPAFLTATTNAEIPDLGEVNFGGALRGYFLPPVSGGYNFSVAGDDASELRLSTSDRPEDAVRIAFSSAATDRRRWTQFPSQRSRSINLEAGNAYYLEALVKEGSGADHLAVAWASTAAGSGSLQMIPGRYLAPYATQTAPHVADQSVALHRNAFPDARFARMEPTDVSGNTAFTFQLVSTTVAGLVSVGATDGWIRVADTNLLARTSATKVTLRIRATSPGGLSSTGVLTCQLAGASALVAVDPVAEIFSNIGNSTVVAGLTNHARFPRRPDELRTLLDATPRGLELPPNSGNSYGSRVRALLVAPATGSYRFYIASDDNSELWLGTSASPSSARIVARVAGAVNPKTWTTQTGQRSVAISLTANQRYYLESRHKEGTGEDHLAVAWTSPGVTSPRIIPMESILPVDLNYPPVFADATATVASQAATGTTVAELEATDSSLDLLAWRIAGGNQEGIFKVDPDLGIVSVASSAALLASARTSWSLLVEVQDSGYGDQYPRQSSSALVTITRVSARSPFDEWAEANGISGSRPEDDGDGDGANNLLEFALGGNPKVADAALLHPRVSLVSEGTETRALLSYRRRQDAVGSGLSYQPEVRLALSIGTWAPAVSPGDMVSSSTDGLPPGYEEVTVRLAEPVPSENATRWFRVWITPVDSAGRAP